jgi:hypothetical protein
MLRITSKQMDEKGGAGSRARSLGQRFAEPLMVAAVLLLCVLYMAGMLYRTYDDPAGADQGLNATLGHGLVQGRLLYADMWDQKPPGVYVAYALAELAVGYGPQQFFVLNLLGWTVALLGLYQSGKLLVGKSAGLGAGLIWAFLVVLPEWFTQPNAEVFISAAMAWSYFALLRLSSRPRWGWACAFGAAVGLASMFKPTIFAAAGLMGVGYIAGSWRQNGNPWLAARHMLAVAGVSLALWAACLSLFWYQGSLGDFYDTVVLYNRHYSGNMLHNIAHIRYLTYRNYLLLVILPCLLIPFVSRVQASQAQRSGWLALAGWGAGCAIAIALTGHWYMHYYQLWMPVYALAAGALLMTPLAGSFPRHAITRSFLLAAVIGPLVYFHPFHDVPDQRFDHNRADCRRLGIAIDRVLLPSETAYVFGYLGNTGGVYFACHRQPPCGIIFDFPLESGPLVKKFEQRILHDLDQNPPDLIVLSKRSFGPALEGKPVPWGQKLVDWIAQHYVLRCFPAPDKYASYARRGSALEQRLPSAE